MAMKRKLAVLMTGTCLASVIGLTPTLRHALEAAPRRWFANRPTTDLRVVHHPPIEARSEPKVTLRATPIGPATVLALAGPSGLSPAREVPLLPASTATPTAVGPAQAGPADGPASPAGATETGAPTGPSAVTKDPDAPLLRQAIDAYRRNDLAAGDAAARQLQGSLTRLTAEWAAVKLDSHLLGVERLKAFVSAHPDWPAVAWVNRRIEESVAADRSDPAQVVARLGNASLKTVAGRLALAEAERSLGHAEAAGRLVHAMWRNDDLLPWQEITLAHDFADVINREDHRIRAERFLYKEKIAPGLKEATLGGPDLLALARARVAVITNSGLADAALAAVPPPLQRDPLIIFSHVQRLRRGNRVEEAADLLLSAPRDGAEILDGDEWWTERRIVARKLLDLGDFRKAYRVCAERGPASAVSEIEASFHAGWIALRFLNDPTAAAAEFDRVATLAETPISKARAAYWQGRTDEARGAIEAALHHYEQAAAYSITFYGQLASAKLGRTAIVLHNVTPATGASRSDAVRVADYLYGLGVRDIALPLALEIARAEPSDAQVGALGEVLERNRDAWATLAVGKAATLRGLAVDDTAFPTFGIPAFRPLPRSADLAVVYAIARQESEFDPKVSSPAGAKGLMQMISTTARSTAARANIPYDDGRLMNDPAFNAQLGAAHLGTLLDEQQGSYILTFAAYNAGGRSVRDWIAAYGDPRKPGIDMVDWIERIPYSETRNYVQRVMENVQIYRAKLGNPSLLMVESEPRPIGKGT